MATEIRKKLIEVALPLDAINEASGREKSIRHGHPSTLHLWWARRPLAACRAVLFAQLVDDPSSHPEKFPTNEAVDKERKRLFGIIEKMVRWENSTNEEVLESARAEIRASCGDELPPVYDPFSGGCSIPLEAQRLGLPAFGSDLNPVAVMIGKAMIEIPPLFKDCKPVHPGGNDSIHYRHAEGLAEDVKYYGEWMRNRAFERIGHLYPLADLPRKHGGGKVPIIAWIWARTVPSPDPAFSDVNVPIAASFLLCSKPGKEAWVEPIVDRSEKKIQYRIRYGGTKEEIKLARVGTKSGRGAHFRCLLSGSAIPPDFVKTSGRHGRMSQVLLAVVVSGKRGRIYIDPTSRHYEIADSARPDWKPEEPLPADLRAFWTPLYGLRKLGALFTDRQLVALNTFAELVHEARLEIESDALAAGLSDDPTPLRERSTGARAYAQAVSVYLAFVVDKCSDYWSSICSWHSSRELIRNTFGRQGIPMTWDFAEANPFCSSTGNWNSMLNWVWKVLVGLTPSNVGYQTQSDAQTVALDENAIVSTDPPYYDNIGYADLSDFFFCWMKRTLRDVYPELFSVLATPKHDELVATPYRHGSKAEAESFFLRGMSSAVENMAHQASSEFPTTIFYAFKQSEIDSGGISSTGWATFLQAIVESGYAVVGTWPMRTEMRNRMIASGTNALANSVVLVCRKRFYRAETVTRAEFNYALKREIPPAMEELRKANISPADMPQSAIGPGMGVFSRFRAVLEPDDSVMSVKTALQLINRELDEYLGGIQGEFDADTRFALTWFQQHGMKEGDYGDANNIAMARGVSVESVQHAGIVASAAGKVRILGRDEIDPNWEPASDTHLTVWECCQHMIRALDQSGERAAAELLKKIGPRHADAANDLAYCLYDICVNKRQNPSEATPYNNLIAVWPELTRQAASVGDDLRDRQVDLGF